MSALIETADSVTESDTAATADIVPMTDEIEHMSAYILGKRKIEPGSPLDIRRQRIAADGLARNNNYDWRREVLEGHGLLKNVKPEDEKAYVGSMTDGHCWHLVSNVTEAMRIAEKDFSEMIKQHPGWEVTVQGITSRFAIEWDGGEEIHIRVVF